MYFILYSSQYDCSDVRSATWFNQLFYMIQYRLYGKTMLPKNCIQYKVHLKSRKNNNNYYEIIISAYVKGDVYIRIIDVGNRHDLTSIYEMIMFVQNKSGLFQWILSNEH